MTLFDEQPPEDDCSSTIGSGKTPSLHMIETHQIQRSFGRVRAVRGVSVSIEPGRVTALLGPNGAGKTTTIRMIAGTLAPDAGTVRIAGQPNPAASHALRRRIGYLPENASPYPEMTGEEYLRYRARLYGIERSKRSAALEQTIEHTGLNEMRRRPIARLSKGYRQRVGLAAALIHDPSILILDEPTNGLDPTQLGEMRSLIRSLAERRTLLICSHVLPEVQKICDRALVIAGGRLVADVDTSSSQPAAVYAEYELPDDREAASLADHLRSLGGCERAHITASEGRWTARLPRTSRAEVARTLHNAGAIVHELRDDRPDLESVFMRAVEQSEGEAAP